MTCFGFANASANGVFSLILEDDVTSITRRQLIQGSAATGVAVTTGAAGWAALSAQNDPTAELTIGWPVVTFRTEPGRANIGMFPLNTNIFETLAWLTPDYQLEPLLAESWELQEDGATWRFTLRQGVTFHDGQPFTAEAVRYSMDRLTAAEASPGLNAESVVIIDDYTVDITPTTPNFRFVEQLVHPNRGAIVAPGSEPADVRVGTGPFREVEYVPESTYVVEANPDYWGEAPGVGKIKFVILPDATTRVLALQAGDVDMIAELPRESVLDIESTGDLQVLTSPVGAYSALSINVHGEAPYDLGSDLVIRRAIAQSIDKEAIVEGIWQGNAEPGVSIIPPAMLDESVNLIEGIPYDLAAAQTSLDGDGWMVGSDGIREREGRRLALELISGYPNAAAHGQLPDLLQAQLLEAGIDVRITQAADSGVYEGILAQGAGDLWLENGSQNDANPCFLPALLFSSPDPEADDEANSYANLFSPGEEFDSIIAQCSVSPTTADVKVAAAEAIGVVVDSDIVAVPIAGIYRIFGAKASVTGFEPHPSGTNQRWTSIVLEG